MRKVLCVAIAAAALHSYALESETVDGRTWRYRDLGNGVELWGYERNGKIAQISGVYPSDGDVAIPDQLGGKPVVGIGDYTFWNCGNMTSVSIPSSVTNIAARAFMNCWSILNIVLPENVRSIGGYAFAGCSSLKSVTIQGDLDFIGECAFSNCTELASLEIHENFRRITIGNGAFCGCERLVDEDGWLIVGNVLYGYAGFSDDIAIPEGVLRVDSAFADMSPVHFDVASRIKSVIFPLSITSVGASAFGARFSGVERVNIHDVSKWCAVTFGNIEANPLMQGRRLYLDGQELAELTIPDGVEEISDFAFAGCASLVKVTIPDSVVRIGEKAFFGCKSLVEARIPKNAIIGPDCFAGCPVFATAYYRTVFGMNDSSSQSSQQCGVSYDLASAAADRSIASLAVDSDCAIDSFVLKDGKVYDSVLYITSTANRPVTLSLPSGYTYKTMSGAMPLNIPANSQSILSITRVADKVFLVAREDLETVAR